MEGPKKIQVNCSPGTYGRIRSDPELVGNYAQQLLETQGHFDEVVFAPIEENVEPGQYGSNIEKIVYSPTASRELSAFNTEDAIFTRLVDIEETSLDDSIASPNLWTDSATKLLLDEVKKLCGKVGKSINLKSKNQLWKIIAETFCKEVYAFSPNQVESKFRGLERQYKKAKINNSQTGRSRMTCIYQSELDEVFGVKKGINPEYTLESQYQPPLEHFTQVESSPEPVYNQPSTSKNASKLTERGKVLKKLDDISKRKEERHQTLIEILERRDQERKEREKRREEMGKEIIDLLKEMVNNTTK